MKMNHYIIAIAMVALSMQSALAQTAEHGRILVYDENNQPVPGVVVSIKGQDKTATTDADGAFVLDYGDDDVLTFSHVGYLYKENRVKVKAGKDYIVCLKDRFKDELAGYTNHFSEHQSADDNLGAVSTVMGRDLQKYLRSTYQVESKLMMRGLGYAQLVIGEK